VSRITKTILAQAKEIIKANEADTFADQDTIAKEIQTYKYLPS
jgi:hypothetical protein